MKKMANLLKNWLQTSALPGNILPARCWSIGQFVFETHLAPRPRISYPPWIRPVTSGPDPGVISRVLIEFSAALRTVGRLILTWVRDGDKNNARNVCSRASRGPEGRKFYRWI